MHDIKGAHQVFIYFFFLCCRYVSHQVFIYFFLCCRYVLIILPLRVRKFIEKEYPCADNVAEFVKKFIYSINIKSDWSVKFVIYKCLSNGCYVYKWLCLCVMIINISIFQISLMDSSHKISISTCFWSQKRKKGNEFSISIGIK